MGSRCSSSSSSRSALRARAGVELRRRHARPHPGDREGVRGGPQARAHRHGEEAGRDGLGHEEAASSPRRDACFMVVIDGDAQNPVEDVLRMYREMRRTGRRGDEGPAHRALRRRLPRPGVLGLQRRVPAAVPHPWHLGRERQAEGPHPGSRQRMELRLRRLVRGRGDRARAARRLGLDVAELPVCSKRTTSAPRSCASRAIFEFVRNMARARLR